MDKKHFYTSLMQSLILISSLVISGCQGTNSDASGNRQDDIIGPEDTPTGEEPGEQTIIQTGLSPNADIVLVKLGITSSTMSDGKKWDTAYDNLKDAIKINENKDELVLVVAADRAIEVESVSVSGDWLDISNFKGTKLSIFGGFKGDETDFSKIDGRGDFPARPLVIDAKAKGRIIGADFSKGIIGAKQGGDIKLFGIVLRNGKAFGGGALFIKHAGNLELFYTKWIKNNSDAGSAILAANCTVKIKARTIFRYNKAEASGGALNILGGAFTVDGETIFANNEAINGNGGAIRVFNSPILINQKIIFSKNKAATGGSAISTMQAAGGDTSKIVGAAKASGSNNWEQN